MNLFFWFYLVFFFTNANAQLQNEDFATVAQMEARGLTTTQAEQAMLSASKVYINSLGKLFSEAVTDGDFSTDINSLTLKTVPVDDDILMIEDSEDSFIKKKIKVSELVKNDLDKATTKCDIIVFDGTEYQRLGCGTNGQALIANSATATGLEFGNPTAASPLTTKGDIMSNNGTIDVRVAVGADNTFLRANSASSSGLSYVSINTASSNADGVCHRYFGGFQICYGNKNITPVANTTTCTSINFSTNFGTFRSAQVTPNTTVPATTVQGWSYTGAGNSGMDMCVYRTNTTSTNLSWTAIGSF